MQSAQQIEREDTNGHHSAQHAVMQSAQQEKKTPTASVERSACGHAERSEREKTPTVMQSAQHAVMQSAQQIEEKTPVATVAL